MCDSVDKPVSMVLDPTLLKQSKIIIVCYIYGLESQRSMGKYIKKKEILI